MITTLEELIAWSGDSNLRHYQFANGLAELVLDMSEIDAKVKISIQTDTVMAGRIAADDHVRSTCRLELLDLSELLCSENGSYLPPPDFPTLMKHRRNAVTIAYGRRVNEARWILSIVGYSRLFSCLVASPEAVSWCEVERR